MEKYKKYLKESSKLHMKPKEIADLYGPDILQKAKTEYGKSKGIKIRNLAVAVFEYLSDKEYSTFQDLAERMGDGDLKETAKEILRQYGK